MYDVSLHAIHAMLHHFVSQMSGKAPSEGYAYLLVRSKRSTPRRSVPT